MRPTKLIFIKLHPLLVVQYIFWLQILQYIYQPGNKLEVTEVLVKKEVNKESRYEVNFNVIVHLLSINLTFHMQN